jgi:glycogen debranching enzyme
VGCRANIRTMGKPQPVTDIREDQVIKHDRAFFLSDRFGDVPEGNQAALGLYYRDTRFLSRLELSLDELHPLLLHSSTERNYAQTVELAYPITVADPQGFEYQENLSLSRMRLLADSLLEQIEVSNYGSASRSVRLRLQFDADFLDVFEVRGLERVRTQPPQHQTPQVGHNSVTFACRGADGVVRTTTIRFSPAPQSLDEREAVFERNLAPGEKAGIVVEIVPEVGERVHPRLAYREARQGLEQQYAAWRKRCTRFKTSNTQLSRFLDRAILDLRMLLSQDDQGDQYFDAGVPWFSALFGRDSLLTAYECLGVNPALAWGVLRGLAARQGTREDEWREEEPGKILHELRVGELAGAGEIPHTPYFGSVDATPLWLVVLTYAYSWTGDLEAVRALWPNALAALEWIDRYGDLDGDGYVEYRRRSARGLDNQGWKDSWNALVHPDGSLAEPPIALVEVQGYVYQAKSRLARLARDLGEDDLAARLDREANELKERFNRDFWMEKEGYLALALDGRKQQVGTITSNPGQCLWSGIIDDDKAGRVARKLLSPALSSGWGVRTLAAKQSPFDPLGYHTGTVWPHDNALIAHGLKLSGFDSEAMRVIDELSLAGAYFPLGRYPELFCGFSREEVPMPVEYPVACRPQAWSTGAPLLMLRSYGGLSADAPKRRLYIVRPQLPAWLDRMEVVGMRVGSARVDLTLLRRDGVTAIQVPHKEGDVEVLIRQ